MGFHKGNFEITVLVVSIVSCICSLFIIVTVTIFSEMKKKMFMKFIYYIAWSDFLMNVASVFGFPRDGSALCWAQGIIQNYFALCSFFWTTMLSYSMFSIVKYGKPNLKLWQMQLICWLFPLVLTLLPLSSAAYGTGSSDFQWCIIVGKDGYSDTYVVAWSYCAYFGWLILSVILMTVWGIMSYLKIRELRNDGPNTQISISLTLTKR